MEWLLEIALVCLLAATLFHSLRLERALGVLKRDRAALEELVASFNDSTRAAEQGIDRLRNAADGAGRQIARQSEIAGGLKDDLMFLIERGERLADRLDQLVRSGRTLSHEGAREPVGRDPSQRDPVIREPITRDARRPALTTQAAFGEPDAEPPRMRSQAERDLLRALRSAR